MKIVLYIVLMVMVSIPGIVLRFMRPELTETQLFLEYWYVWLAELVIIGCIYWMSNRMTK